MNYETDQRLKCYLDSNQLAREQMCLAIMQSDKRFSEVRPRHPRGGPDGGRDIEATFKGHQTAFGAVGFLNQANDSDEQKKKIEGKFLDDLASAISAKNSLAVFIFMTNLNFTLGEKESLCSTAKKSGISHCEIFDRERLRIVLDSTDGLHIRFQYLQMPLSEAEQASFFSRWGDGIQELLTTEFTAIALNLKRIMFLQEFSDPISDLVFAIELNKSYSASEISHYRVYFSIHLNQMKKDIFEILLGSADGDDRFNGRIQRDDLPPRQGIGKGVSSAAWHRGIEMRTVSGGGDGGEMEYVPVENGSGRGLDPVEFITLTYSQHAKGGLRRFSDPLSLRDLDASDFLPFINKSLADKIKYIHVFSNGYKIKEISLDDMRIDLSQFDAKFPGVYSDGELADPWVRIRPSFASTYDMDFSKETPIRMSSPIPVTNSLEKRKRQN